jgi:hypothetical protein
MTAVCSGNRRDEAALLKGTAGHCSGYPRNCARFRQGIERGYLDLTAWVQILRTSLSFEGVP